MRVIAGAHAFLKQHGYEIRRTGPLEFTVFDCETESGQDEVVCKGRDHADATRNLMALRFSD
jgi:hypothetical protein